MIPKLAEKRSPNKKMDVMRRNLIDSLSEDQIKTAAKFRSKTKYKGKAKYYISPFDFFYAKDEELGSKFSKSAYCGAFGEESEEYDLSTILKMIAKGFQENENCFIDAYIDISDLISGVVKRVYSEENIT